MAWATWVGYWAEDLGFKGYNAMSAVIPEPVNRLIEAFAQFALSPPGQAIIAETYVPMPSQ